MARIEMYTKDYCPYCTLAKRLLESKGQQWEEINLSKEPERVEEMLERSQGRQTVPEILINGRLVGGFDELAALERAGELDAWLTD
ncbi:MAG: glutaredoxin 3 [Planctomycetota bacterium]|nr:MAG: glutaredoxin 3 [Planctomycetota bacterium]